ncbi:MAG: hypothetical protein EPN25_07530 [Nitrospirae bacterium]|nr:MAG: hypothetical protein EPN25_07530 [Nitrospirota bacterium]
MSRDNRVLLLIGSPKKAGSTSESLGDYLLGSLGNKGFETEKIQVVQALRTPEGISELLWATDTADILLLVFPLYVDSLHSGVIRALELIACHRAELKQRRRQKLVAISNSGFPEAHHSEVALAICRRFAGQAGFDWAGGLALGGGEAIAGIPLDKAGGRARFARQALDMVADALEKGMPVPQEAVELMGRPFIPKWMYIWFGSMGWKRLAKKNGVLHDLQCRPFE